MFSKRARANPVKIYRQHPEAGAFYVMDRGYLDFKRLYALHQSGGYFVTRAKRNSNNRRIASRPVERSTGLVCDQTVMLNNFYAAKDYPGQLLRVRYRGPTTHKSLADQTVLRHVGERREESGVDCRQHLCVGGNRPEAAECGSVTAYDVASSERDVKRVGH